MAKAWVFADETGLLTRDCDFGRAGIVVVKISVEAGHGQHRVVHKQEQLSVPRRGDDALFQDKADDDADREGAATEAESEYLVRDYGGCGRQICKGR